MAIKEKDILTVLENYRVNDDSITLSDLALYLNNKATEVGIPVAFAEDSLVYGNIFSSKSEPCFVMYHPEHVYDYMRVAVSLRTPGNYSIISFKKIVYNIKLAGINAPSQSIGASLLSSSFRGRLGERDKDDWENSILAIIKSF